MNRQRSSGEWSLAVRQQAAVARLGQIGLQGVDLEDLLAEALALLVDTLDVRHAALFELLAGSQELQGRAGMYEGRPVDRAVVEILRLPAGRESLPGYTVLEGVAVMADDLLGDPRFHARAPEFGVAAGAAISAPIGWDDKPWGVLGAYSAEIRAWTDDEVHFLQSIANTVGLAIQRQRIEHELRESSIREQLARFEAEAARERLAVLADASVRFSASLDQEVILGSLAEFCVPLLADVCLVDVLDEQGRLREGAAAARDPGSLADLRALRRRRQDAGDRGDAGGVGGPGDPWDERRVAAQIGSLVWDEITDDHYRSVALDDEHLALMRRFGARAATVTPLRVRDRVIGVLTLIATQGGRAYPGDHPALVEELASRAALALDNGRLFESRHRVARSLQAALLPPALPEVAGLELAARYRVAEADIEIGGDFYDVIELGDRAWGVVVGDVCGRGPDAAALTGLMRHSLRTAVVRERWPSRVLSQTNAAVLHQIDDSRFCTAAYLRVEVGERSGDPVRVMASSAGHPRPAVLRADGRAELLDCAGLLLGVVPTLDLVDAEVELGPGDAVVLYTDGVTEARRGADLFGDDRLLDTLRHLVGRPAEAVAAGIDDAVRAFQDDANDDVAILVVRVPDRRPAVPAAAGS